MNISRRTFVAATVATAAFTALPAIAQQRTQLNVLYSNAYVNKDLMEEVKASFEKSNPNVELKYDVVKNYTEMTQLMLRSALTDSVPDVGFQGLNFVRLFAERGLAVPLDPFIAEEANWSNNGFSESALEMAKLGDSAYGIPFEISIPTIYYNADLVRQAGGNPEKFPTTWREIAALGAKIQATSGGIYFDYLPTGNWTFIALVQSLGGSMMAPDDRTIMFNGAEGEEALSILHSIGNTGMQDMTRDQAKQAFVGGSLGILVTSSSDITLYTEQVAGRFDLKVAPFPVVEGSGRLPAGGNAVMIHTKDVQKQKLAWEFVKHVSSPEVQTVMATRTAYMPVSEKAISDPAMLGDFYAEHPNLLVPINQLPIVTGWFSFPGENSLKITKVIEDKLREVIVLHRDPSVVLVEMTDAVAQMLPK
ncbi:ABC transporter substrate-binding protein [Pseudochelatococcus sp. B33]